MMRSRIHRAVRRLALLTLAAPVWLLLPADGDDSPRVGPSVASAQAPTDKPGRTPRRKPEETAPAPVLPPSQQAEVQRVEQYLNSVRSLQARFSQTGSDGRTAPGTLSLQRPGRMRFEYDPPATILIVADGSQVTLADFKDKSMSQWPLGWTSASFLAAEQVKLSGDLTVTNVARSAGELRVTVIQTKRPQEGRVELLFATDPVLLKGWTVWDAKSVPVTVALTNLRTGVDLARDLFRFDESQLKRDRFQ
ncbi:MAG TPA: outer-membrane lipoprotein carrier protein LolA [Vineibacter sp.]|nr:outer-membrane lipoprotein carrier protein LolA [Vineibacter sp.]